MNEKHKIIRTKFGTAKINNRGYYQITSRKEGNHRKLLHRLIFENFYGSIPECCVIHHKDGDKLNNYIMNLQLLTEKEHKSLHRKAENHPRAKYTLWDNSKVHYNKSTMFKQNPKFNPRKCFQYKYKGYRVPIGYFHDFVSVEIINELVEDAIGGYE